MAFPFYKRFNRYLKNERLLAPTTIIDIDNDIERFFYYLRGYNSTYQQVASVAALSEADVKEYLIRLQVQRAIKNTTYNKILTHLNIYFIFLFKNHLSSSLPTLNLKCLPKNKHGDIVPQNWSTELVFYLNNSKLNFYTRLMLLLLAHFYTITEIIDPDFYHILANEQWNKSELNFLKKFEVFYKSNINAPYSHALFLKAKLNIANPSLSLPGLHKILKKDRSKIELPLKPTQLYQNAILNYIAEHQNETDIQLCEKMHLTLESLNYYRSLT